MVDVLIKLDDVDVIQITGDYFCPATHINGNQDYRKLSLRVNGIYLYDDNNAYFQKIENIKLLIKNNINNVYNRIRIIISLFQLETEECNIPLSDPYQVDFLLVFSKLVGMFETKPFRV